MFLVNFGGLQPSNFKADYEKLFLSTAVAVMVAIGARAQEITAKADLRQPTA